FRTNPQDKKAPGKYYPYPVYENTIELDDFVKEISHATSLTSTDIRATILEVIEIFHRYLVRDHKVKLDGIGTFKVSFKGDGAIAADDLTSSNIDRPIDRQGHVRG
ncbi:MAG: HU family DNA-binding protein, partial [Treponemataceae bacterium]|nr:HU family DNA-binding protein [Treponemataceae bacterium]